MRHLRLELEERVAEHPLWASAGREELAAAGDFLISRSDMKT